LIVAATLESGEKLSFEQNQMGILRQIPIAGKTSYSYLYKA